jgi:ubiquinone/menaquinone biosynthesis C-methylase UbiE
MKTDYIIHDEVYQKHKAEGKSDWSTPEQIQEDIKILEKVLQAEYIPKSGKLLVLGCGAGEIALWLAEKGYEIYGVDIAPTAITWAQKKAKEHNIKADFRVGDVLDLQDYPDDFFDVILDGHCFHCIIGEDRKRFLASARRVLKPGGCLFVDTMCGEITNEEVKKHFDPQSRCYIIKDEIVFRYVGFLEDILDEIRKANFHILHWEIKVHKDQNEQDDLLVAATKLQGSSIYSFSV